MTDRELDAFITAMLRWQPPDHPPAPKPAERPPMTKFARHIKAHRNGSKRGDTTLPPLASLSAAPSGRDA
jgi:hypothetical protein